MAGTIMVGVLQSSERNRIVAVTKTTSKPVNVALCISMDIFFCATMLM